MLEAASVAAAPGVFYVFREPGTRAAFLASRFQRPPARPRLDGPTALFDRHQDLFAALFGFLGAHGRLPAADELAEHDAIVAAVGSLARAQRILERTTGADAWRAAAAARRQDLLVYLALARFDRRPAHGELSTALRLDLKAFFGRYSTACREADELLFSLGRPGQIEAACRSAPFGKLMPEALYVHFDAVTDLPLLLRLYEGCARSYLGAVPGATLVKLRFGEPKVSYLAYPDFASDPHPALAASTSVDLRSFRVRMRSYERYRNPPILHRKEAFLPEHARERAMFLRLTRAEEARGLYDDPSLIGTRDGWAAALERRGLRLRGHRLVKSSAR